MDITQQLLQVSAKLYQHLNHLPKSEDRDEYIEKVHLLLDERNTFIIELQNQRFVFDAENKTHRMAAELDKGITERLNNVLVSIREDLKTLQKAKKNEKQYVNPYASVQVMDGRYYDKKN